MNKEVSYALTPSEISDIAEEDIDLVLYPELSNYDSIYDILYPSGIFILLYQTDRNFGHYNLVFERGDGSIEVFDPYGYEIDEKIGYMRPYFREAGHLLYPNLTDLLLKSDKNIHYNDKELQDRNNPDISTCGRWCAQRAKDRYISIDKFQKKFIGKKKKPDDIIVEKTRKYIL